MERERGRLRGIELNAKTVGIIGYGRIGKKMARYCNAFGARFLIYDPYQEKIKIG